MRRCSAFDDDEPFDAHDIGDITVVLEEPGIARWPELIFFKVVNVATASPTDAAASTNIATRQLILMLASEW